MRKAVPFLLILLLAIPSLSWALDQDEFGFSPQFGGTLFFARMGELISPDITYGAAFDYAVLSWIAIDFEILYSEHQQTDSRKIGNVQFNHLQTGVGPRFNYHNHYVVPYGVLALGGNFFKWQNRTVADDDEYDGNGMAIYLTLGADFYIHDSVTLGIATKGSIARSDFEFVTNDGGSESISDYGFLSALVRLTVIF